MAMLLLATAGAWAQGAPEGYNPFVPANLDDPSKMIETTVVESSYHKYSIKGDPNYTAMSNFVWYVENGTFGTYNEGTDTWTPWVGVLPLGAGVVTEKEGTLLNGVNNSSEIWVRWNDGTGGKIGYVAVYERSSTNCVVDNRIDGYKHILLSPPEVWFTTKERMECADQSYTVDVQFDQIDENSYPYRLTYTYPDLAGSIQTSNMVLNSGDISATFGLAIAILINDQVQPNADVNYPLKLVELRDKYGSLGKVAPGGEARGQYPEITITTYHLPKTGGMRMD
jgi:hypothetical protein